MYKHMEVADVTFRSILSYIYTAIGGEIVIFRCKTIMVQTYGGYNVWKNSIQLDAL